jgi:hypothetical protein
MDIESLMFAAIKVFVTLMALVSVGLFIALIIFVPLPLWGKVLLSVMGSVLMLIFVLAVARLATEL